MEDMKRQVQLIEYEIFKVFDSFCKKHDIKYFLGQGTLLGAAKYKKFIPWDDDIDLLIPYKELKKIHSLFPKECPEELFLTNFKEEKHYPLAWSKIRNKNTLSRPVLYKELPINWGICIDLFPVFSLSNIKLIRNLEYFALKLSSKMLLAEMTRFEPNHGFVVRFLEKIPICLRHLFAGTVYSIINLHSDKTKYVFVSCKAGRVIERTDIFGEAQSLFFEDAEYPAPAKYHKYLTEMYGDYMAPLPESEQGGHDLRMGEIEWKI